MRSLEELTPKPRKDPPFVAALTDDDLAALNCAGYDVNNWMELQELTDTTEIESRRLAEIHAKLVAFRDKS